MPAVQGIQRLHRPGEAFVVPQRHRVDGRLVKQLDVDPAARSFRLLPHPVHVIADIEHEHMILAVSFPGFRDMGRYLRILFQPAVQIVAVKQEHPAGVQAVSAHQS